MGYVLPEKTLMETQKGKLLWAALRLSLRKLKYACVVFPAHTAQFIQICPLWTHMVAFFVGHPVSVQS